MSQMFWDASSFNGNIGNWDVSNVTNMTYIFHKASSFNQDIGNWNTSSAWTMNSTFRKAFSFNQDISNWNVVNVTTYPLFSQDAPINSTSKVPAKFGNE